MTQAPIALPLEGKRVSRCYVDAFVGIQFFDELLEYEATIMIESDFALGKGTFVWSLSVDDKVGLGRFLTIIGKTVASAMAQVESGTLEVLFTDGTGLTVAPHDEGFESWEYRDSNGLRVVCLPGGRLGVQGLK